MRTRIAPVESDQIVEYSYSTKEKKYVVRFLNGNSYVVKVKDLPRKLQTKKPKWEKASLSSDRTYLTVRAGREARKIASHVIHARGTIV